MRSYKPGDRVQLLDDMMSGIVVSVTSDTLQIESPEGFILEVAPSKVVLIPLDDGELWGSGDYNMPSKDADLSPARPGKSRRRHRQAPPMEVDLHIEKLVSTTRGLNTMDILNHQLDAAKGQLEFAIRKRIQRIVFIHGVGQGVLKAELRTLFRRYENIEVRDADPRSYGMGATEVYIKQAAWN